MKFKYYMGDFETTVYESQTSTEVWASALVEFGTDNVLIHHSIEETYNYLANIHSNVIVYYHNLKFDGSFWLYYIINKLHLKEAYNHLDNTEFNVEWQNLKQMENGTFQYLISDIGDWYNITIRINNHFIILRDSLKLLPFSVKEIGKAFQTRHQKLEMEYTGYRYAGCNITDEEKEYIANDVLVVKEALELMQQEGHKKTTIGGCCLTEYKKLTTEKIYNYLFPTLEDIEIPNEEYGSSNVDNYIRKSYRGGWCYVAKGKENKIKYNGTTADVNSLYPSMMSSESGNIYPTGKPTFWKGNQIPIEAMLPFHYYFIRFKTRFYIKENKLPFVQIKGSFLYPPTECLESSDVYNYKDDKYYPYYIDIDGHIKPAIVELTMTMTDYILFREYYDVEDFEILDGCYFKAEAGIFDDYIEKYKKIKMESKGAKRTLAKLFLNNLYGKMATNTNSSFKIAVENEEKLLFVRVKENNKKAGYIPVGSAITSYARNFTIRSAQKNYYGKDKRGFIYADTDSIHCDLQPNELRGIKVHPNNFCCWKLESQWDKGFFVRQKTYIEHIICEDEQPIENTYYNLKCAGMPERCKYLFSLCVTQEPIDNSKFLKEELDFLYEDKEHTIRKKLTIEDFKVGLVLPSKLMPKQIEGGTLLINTTYMMR